VTRGACVSRLLIRVLVLLCALTYGASSSAQEAKRVVVQNFRGPSGGAVRNHIVTALRDQHEVELAQSAAFEGLTGSALHDAAAEAGVSAFVQGRVTKKGKLLSVSVSVRDADTGEVVGEESWTKKKPQLDDVGHDFWSKLGPAILRTRAPEKKAPPPVAAAKPEPVAEKPPPVAKQAAPEPEPERASDRPHAPGDEPVHPALIVTAGPRLLWRSLDYDGGTLNGYSSYNGASGTGPGFALALNAQWFPGAHVTRRWPSDIGLELDGDYAFLKSTYDGKKLKTRAYDVAGSLLYRLPLDSFEPIFRVGYVLQVFDVKAPMSAELPGVAWGSIRLSAGTLIHILRAFSLDIAAGYLIVVSTGELGKKRYAEDLSAYGWEIGGGGTYRIRDAYGIRLGAEFRRYGFDTGKSENDRVVLPKSGHDDYLRLTLAFVYALPGK
jgi:hypothetical protein